jgi:hypothetical protein
MTASQALAFKAPSSKTASLATALGLASAIIAMAAAPSYAQSYFNDDAPAHVYSPRTSGECWHPTDAAFSERGFGYWGACATQASAPVAAGAHHARVHKHVHHQNH